MTVTSPLMIATEKKSTLFAKLRVWPDSPGHSLLHWWTFLVPWSRRIVARLILGRTDLPSEGWTGNNNCQSEPFRPRFISVARLCHQLRSQHSVYGVEFRRHEPSVRRPLVTGHIWRFTRTLAAALSASWSSARSSAHPAGVLRCSTLTFATAISTRWLTAVLSATAAGILPPSPLWRCLQ